MIQLWAELWSASLEFYCCFSFTTGTSTCGTDEEHECMALHSLGHWDNPIDNWIKLQRLCAELLLL